MNRNYQKRTLASVGLGAALAIAAASGPSHAHDTAGARIFISTLQIDDPGVADELALPTVTIQRSGANGGTGPAYQVNINYNFSKRVTEDFAVSIGHGFSWINTSGSKSQSGFNNVQLAAKYKAYVNPEHEFVFSAGLTRVFGTTGSAQIGADRVSSTIPNLYFGKGFGDLPIGVLRPFAVTGQIGYAVSERGPKTDAVGNFNNGFNNRWVGGLTLQYSISYLQSQVKDYGLPEWLGRMTPLVELGWSSPTRPHDTPTQIIFAPGVAYNGHGWQFTAEALIPGNRNTGKNIGFAFEFHMYFDDLLPNTLGKPIVKWFR